MSRSEQNPAVLPLHLKPLFYFLDILFMCLIAAPLTIGFWRGSWTLMDIYESFLPMWGSFLFGVGVQFALTVIKQDLQKFSEKLSGRPALYLKILYTYFFANVCIMQWRSGWLIFDKCLSINTKKDGTGLFVSLHNSLWICATWVCFVLILGYFRCIWNLLTLPFAFETDRQSGYFDFPTRFRRTIENNFRLYILDCLFSVLIVGTLVVFVWRGAWVLIDIYLFPEDERWSSWGSLIIGYSAVAVTFAIQPGVRWLCEHTKGGVRLMIADSFLCLSFVGTVNVWRGIWNLLNIYFVPENLELSCWITHWVSLILLMLLRCSNTLLVRGVYIDAEEPGGKCVVFPIYYLRLIFQNEHARQISKKFKQRRKQDETTDINVACTCGAEIKNHLEDGGGGGVIVPSQIEV